MSKAELGTLLFGLDCGTKSLGIAIGNSITSRVRPLQGIYFRPTDLTTWAPLDRLMNQWAPEGAVFGRPLNMDNSEFWMTEVADKAAEQFRRRYQIAVYFQDERLSTLAAKAHLFETEGARSLYKSRIDSVASALILEDFFRSKGL